MELTLLRRSRFSCMLDVQDGSRCPFRVLEVADSNPAPSGRVRDGRTGSIVIPEHLGINHLAQSESFTVRTLGFKQYCLHPTVRVSTSVPLGGFAAPRLSTHASVPFSFRCQVNVVTQGSHAQPIPCFTGIKHAVMRRTGLGLLRRLRDHGARAR